MKGYKVFDPDWTCLWKQYAVGEIATQNGDLKICGNGIHFCTKLEDCFRYYNANPDNKLAEVEAVGDVLCSDEDSKCCTDKLKVVKELSIAELLKDKDFCLKIIERDPGNVQFMEKQDREVFLAAVKQNGCMLVYVPENMKTPEICLAAIQQNGWALCSVPDKLKTAEFCLIAVQNDSRALPYVPYKLRTTELCLIAIQKNCWALEYIPKKQITSELCMAAVEQNGQTLQLVPEELKTMELCAKAVKQDGLAIEYVPKNLVKQVFDMVSKQ